MTHLPDTGISGSGIECGRKITEAENGQMHPGIDFHKISCKDGKN